VNFEDNREIPEIMINKRYFATSGTVNDVGGRISEIWSKKTERLYFVILAKGKRFVNFEFIVLIKG